MNPEIKITQDGSPTLYLKVLDETYHSLYGARTESTHIYIKNGLLHRAKCGNFNETERIRIFEIGFGSGLNALLSLNTGLPINYTSIEKYPLAPSIIKELNFGNPDEYENFLKLHAVSWDEDIKITDSFLLRKLNADFLNTEFNEHFDVIFMDAFAPDKQPEMWSDNVIRKIVRMLAPQGVITTYCAKGIVRRKMEEEGLFVERLPGPPGGKREILRATKLR